jgi:hypothetical protein
VDDLLEVGDAPAPRALRSLGTSERFYWLYDKVSCTDFYVAARLRSPVKPGALRAALGRLRERFPLLRTGVAVVGSRVLLVDAPDADIPVSVEAASPAEAVDRMTVELDRRFADSEPPLRARVFEHELGCTLGLSFRHAFIDGASAAVLVQLLLLDLGGVRGSSGPAVAIGPPQEERFPAPLRSALGKVVVLLRNVAAGLVARLSFGAYQQIPPMAGRAPAPRTRSRVLHHRFSAADTEAIRERCRREGTTVTAVLVAAQMKAKRALFQRLGAVTLGVAVAVDLRDTYSDPVNPLTPGLHITLVASEARVLADHDLWVLARKVKEGFTARLRRGAGHLMWSVFPSFLFPPNRRGAQRMDALQRRAPAMSVVTNMGRMDLGEGAEALHRDLEGMFFAMGAQTGCPFVTAAGSLGGRLMLSMASNRDALPEETARQCFGSVVAQLEELIDGAGVGSPRST